MSDEPVFEVTDRVFLGMIVCVALMSIAWAICGTIERVYVPKVCPKCQAMQVEEEKKDE